MTSSMKHTQRSPYSTLYPKTHKRLCSLQVTVTQAADYTANAKHRMTYMHIDGDLLPEQHSYGSALNQGKKMHKQKIVCQ